MTAVISSTAGATTPAARPTIGARHVGPLRPLTGPPLRKAPPPKVELPAFGEWVAVRTHSGARFRGRLREGDGVNVRIFEGAGWWTVPVRGIADIRVVERRTTP